jgi:hypothetical protein
MNALPINIAIASPTPVLTPATTGGTLASATYFYRVVARMAYGPGGPLPGITGTTGEFHNVAGTEASSAVTGPTGSVSISIPYTGGVTHYDIYRGTVTNTEIYMNTVAAAPYVGTATVYVDTGSITPAGALYSTVTASSVLPGNSFVAGGQAGGLNTQLPIPAPPAVSPFLEGRGAVLYNPTAGSITINFSPDGVTAMAAYAVLTTGKVVDISALGGFGSNLTVSGLGGLPKFLVASAAGAVILGSP